MEKRGGGAVVLLNSEQALAFLGLFGAGLLFRWYLKNNTYGVYILQVFKCYNFYSHCISKNVWEIRCLGTQDSIESIITRYFMGMCFASILKI